MDGGGPAERIEEVDMLLLAALTTLEEAVSARCPSVGALPRYPWAAAMLVEQLLKAFGPASGEGRRLSVLADPERGVVTRRALSSLDRLAAAGYLMPVGVGECAAWRLAPGRRPNACGIEPATSDAAALRRATQRTLAIVDDWSKKFRAGAPAKLGTSTSSAARRHPRLS